MNRFSFAAVSIALCGVIITGGAEPALGAGVTAPSTAAPSNAAQPSGAQPTASPERLSHGRFDNVSVYLPSGTPKSAVLLLSGREGWNSSAAELAEALTRHGALVAGIDLPKLAANLEADGDDCVFPDGDLENLSHFIQAYHHVPTYLPPFLVGYGEGASLAYATLAQAPRDTFAGALTVGFCPTTSLRKPLCKGSGVAYAGTAPGSPLEFLPAPSLTSPWVSLQAEDDPMCATHAAADFLGKIKGAAQVRLPPQTPPPQPRRPAKARPPEDARGSSAQLPSSPQLSSRAQPHAASVSSPAALWMPQFLAAFDALAARAASKAAPAAPAALGDLPVIEVPARPDAQGSDTLAIILSGDGGWAGLDKDVAQALTEHGIPVAGLDSLRYFWTARTPEGMGADLDRMVRYYLTRFGKKRALLIGYSQGADVLPFALNHMPAATLSNVALAVLMGMSEHALFEFHVTSWISNDSSGPATLPEVNRIRGIPVLCIYGEGDADTLCPKLDPAKIKVVKLPGGHHFDGDYARLAREILAAAGR
jgi:type IV secretory pathway VirJ component